MLVIMLVDLWTVTQELLTTFVQMQVKIMLARMKHVSVLAYARKLKIFNFFGASEAMRINLQRLYTLTKVL